MFLKNYRSEINAKTDLQFSYTAVKHDGKISGIEFTVTAISEKLESDGPFTTEKR